MNGHFSLYHWYNCLDQKNWLLILVFILNLAVSLIVLKTTNLNQSTLSRLPIFYILVHTLDSTTIPSIINNYMYVEGERPECL